MGFRGLGFGVWVYSKAPTFLLNSLKLPLNSKPETLSVFLEGHRVEAVRQAAPTNRKWCAASLGLEFRI